MSGASKMSLWCHVFVSLCEFQFQFDKLLAEQLPVVTAASTKNTILLSQRCLHEFANLLGDIPLVARIDTAVQHKIKSSQDCQEVPVEMALKRMIRAAGNLPCMLLATSNQHWDEMKGVEGSNIQTYQGYSRT